MERNAHVKRGAARNPTELAADGRFETRVHDFSRGFEESCSILFGFVSWGALVVAMTWFGGITTLDQRNSARYRRNSLGISVANVIVENHIRGYQCMQI